MRDSADYVEVQTTRPWVWVFAFVGLVIAFGVLFPTQLAIAAVILSLPVIIFLHELGHYITARRADMKVTEFFVGFGPRIWSFTRGETEYGLKAVPLGGYCRIIGMTNLDEVDPEDEPRRAYRSKAFFPKVVVSAAGPAMHFIIALILVFGVLWIHGDRSEAAVVPVLDEIAAGSPADNAGLMVGDRLVAIDGQPVDEWQDVVDEISSHEAGQKVTFTVERNGTTRDLDVVLEESTIDGETRVRAGVRPTIHVPQLSLGAALARTPGETWGIATESVGALGDMFSLSGIENYFGILSGDENADQNQRFLSPVGYTRAGSQAVAAGWVETIALIILINVFIGMFNLLPLLPFDGGHIAIAAYEKIASTIMRRPIRADAAKLLPLTGVVVVILAFIFFSSLYLDIANPADNPF